MSSTSDVCMETAGESGVRGCAVNMQGETGVSRSGSRLEGGAMELGWIERVVRGEGDADEVMENSSALYGRS